MKTPTGEDITRRNNESYIDNHSGSYQSVSSSGGASNQQKEEEKQRQLKPLTNESLLEDWDEFRSKINSKSIQASLSNVKFEIKENHLYAYVPSNRTGEVLSDSRYFIGFSDRFKEKEILNSIVVDMEKFPDYNNASETTKPKNDAEKYQFMVNKNPNLEVLRTTLDLKFHT